MIGRRLTKIVIATGSLGFFLAACNQSGRPSVVEVQQSYGAPPTAAVAASGSAYTVIAGDTVYGVAERFQVPIRSLIELNGLQPPYRLATGQSLQIPAQREHVVKEGETVNDVAQAHGIDVSTLTRLNGIPAPYTLRPGQRLLLPSTVPAQSTAVAAAPSATGTTQPAPAAAPSSAVTVMELPPPNLPAPPPASGEPSAAGTATGTPQTGALPQPQVPSAPAAEPATTQPPAAVPQPAPLTGGRFLWPVNGKVVSGFGPREGGLHNDGINIAAPAGTPVRAAENGVVAYAGNELRGFGNMLLIRHADGWMSAYAHNETLLVQRGDNVVRGQTIARVGQTGNVSSPQLHFELRRGAEAVDPMEYLGELGAALPPGAISPDAGRDVPPSPG
ncbi:MAG: hypothetical protein BroJett029_25410 [Alphaproteobacteria bacterium]|nr:MAG: hypothetical protein BroJett029_25410 [Alphaproteobacteria bacterium]